MADKNAEPDEATGAAPEGQAQPDDDLKAKYREALAHKHGSSGVHKSAHGDAGSQAHSQSTGPTQKMFRRKAGG